MYRVAAFFPQAYYLEVETKCSRCNISFDFWNMALDLLLTRSALFQNWAAAFIGAQQAFLEIELGPEEVRELKFSEYGIPDDAKILYLNYTPYGGGMFPVELHGNVPIHQMTPHTVTLYGRPIPKHEGSQSKGKVTVFVAFLTHSADKHELSSLASAFDAFLRDDYEAMVIPASAAIEDSMVRLVTDFLRINGLPTKHRPSKQVTRGIILPLACSLRGVPRQRNHIVALVKDLWGLRDKMAHAGHLDRPLDPATAANLLCAAMFEVNYFRFIYPRLVRTA